MNPLVAADPTRIGDFELLGRLGAGGMGQLYLGRRGDGETAAVKLIRPDLAGQPDFRARFRREIAAAEQADGPYIARVLAADPDAEPPWLAVEYVAAPSLAEAVTEHGPLPVPAARMLLAGLCAGLARLHTLGLVHRDLKPANVLVAADGPRIIDFGVSRVLDSSTITHTGQLLGSPGFMAPEQALGKDQIGPATDVFSLGGLLAYAVTGRSPFGAGPTMAVVYRVVHESPELGEIPEEVRDLVADCLAKDPAERPGIDDILTRLLPDGTTVEEATAGAWLPEAVADDIRRRTAELEKLRRAEPQAETILRNAARPAAEPAGASPAAAPRRLTGRVAAVIGATAAVLAVGVGTGFALTSATQQSPDDAPIEQASTYLSAVPVASATVAATPSTAVSSSAAPVPATTEPAPPGPAADTTTTGGGTQATRAPSRSPAPTRKPTSTRKASKKPTTAPPPTLITLNPVETIGPIGGGTTTLPTLETIPVITLTPKN